MSARGPATIGRFDLLDFALAGTIVGGAILTFAVLAIPGVYGHVVAPAADLVFDTVAVVVTTAVAALTWLRFQERHEPIALAATAAFLALAIADASAVVVAVLLDVGPTAPDEGVPEAQLLVWICARILAASLLVAGGIETLRGRQARNPRALTLATGALVLVVLGIVFAVGDPLTSLVARPFADVVRPGEWDVALTTAGTMAQLVGAGLFLVAALVFRQLWRRDRVVADAYLALGLAIAALAQLHGALVPSRHPEQVGTADLLMLVFSLVLLFGITAEARSVMAELQSANLSLERLRDAEVERAALDERARLSRELHDGLAQDLWLAKLKIGRLAASPELTPGDRTLAEEATKAVEMGLAGARQGVIALRDSGDPSQSFEDLLERYADDVVDRVGLPVEFDCVGSIAPLSSRTKADLLRIVQEALSNAARHADAETIRLSVVAPDGFVSLTVEDDGRGFDPGDVAAGHVGIQVMRERAAIIGAQLTVESSRGGGTRVVVTVPARADGAVGGAT